MLLSERSKKGAGQKTGIKDYQYSYLIDYFKVIVVNFKSICNK